jgi:hypothetical protein
MGEVELMAALGRPAEGSSDYVILSDGREVRVLRWEYGEDSVDVQIDRRAKVVRASARRKYWTLGERVRAWWPW